MEVKRYAVFGSDCEELEPGENTSWNVMVMESDHLATIAELTRERDELREASRWIPVDMAKMEAGTVCDLWEPFHGRLSNYRLVKNYAGKSGNHFFEPVSSGLSCVRTATHYIGIPKGPTL